MIQLIRLTLSGLAFLLITTGCGSVVTAPYSPEGVTVQKDAALRSWAKVLSQYVDEQGRTDFKSLSQHPEELETYVRFLSSESPMTHPQRYPSQNDRLAYDLNSYNALAMYNVIQQGIPQSFSGTFSRLNFFGLKRFELGGPSLSLAEYENQVIRKEGDERIHFALNCMVRGCPHLPKEPFTAQAVQTQLDHQATVFLNEDRNLQRDEAGKVVRFSEILKFYTRDFLKRAPSLIAYANRYARKPIPTDYRTEFIPYDWTINAQPLGHGGTVSSTSSR